jgi:hypothetical protein
MTTSYGFGICECSQCYKRISKAEAHKVTIECVSGRSSGSYRFGRRSVGYSTGRTYYSDRDVWMCNDCYRQRNSSKWIGNAVSIAAIFLLMSFCHHETPSKTSETAAGTPGYHKSSDGKWHLDQGCHWVNPDDEHDLSTHCE